MTASWFRWHTAFRALAPALPMLSPFCVPRPQPLRCMDDMVDSRPGAASRPAVPAAPAPLCAARRASSPLLAALATEVSDAALVRILHKLQHQPTSNKRVRECKTICVKTHTPYGPVVQEVPLPMVGGTVQLAGQQSLCQPGILHFELQTIRGFGDQDFAAVALN